VAVFVDECSDLRLVRNRPSEIDFDVNDLAVAKGRDFGVAKTLLVHSACLAGHQDMIAMWHDVYKIKALNPGRRA
jgi:hypothetical protein